MKISIEKKSDPIIKVPIYLLMVGLNKYHYEKLSDVLLRVAILFEPSQEEKPKKKYAKRSEKFPLGNAILENLPDSGPGITMESIRKGVKTPRTFSKSIWGAVMGKLVNKEKVELIIKNGVPHYRRVK